MKLTKQEARRVILKHLNLYSNPLKGKEGIMEYVKKVGCIQFDPLNIIAMNPHLVLQSRIINYKPELLNELLYKDRNLMDGWDKNMAIFKVEDRPYFKRYYDAAIETHTWRDRSIIEFIPEVREALQNGAITSKDLNLQHKTDWSWAPTSTARALLDLMFFTGELMVHDKLGSRKSYDFTSKYLSKALIESEEPNSTDAEYYKWGVYRRIRATGILWDKASEAYLGIKGMKSKSRQQAYRDLKNEGMILPLEIEGIDYTFYIATKDQALLDDNSRVIRKVSFIAPLDNFIWDRKLINELFDFKYKWEVYTPEKDRKYGYYVLPVLFGDEFIGRIEPVLIKKTKELHIRGLWLDQYPDKAFAKAITAFSQFLGATSITYGDKTPHDLLWLEETMKGTTGA